MLTLAAVETVLLRRDGCSKTEIPNVLDFYHPAAYSKKSRKHSSAFPAPYSLLLESSKCKSDAQVYC